MKNYHRGPWADDAMTAMTAAAHDVGVLPSEYITCEYSDPLYLEFKPVDPTKATITVEIKYSETRLQYQAHLRRVPA